MREPLPAPFLAWCRRQGVHAGTARHAELAAATTRAGRADALRHPLCADWGPARRRDFALGRLAAARALAPSGLSGFPMPPTAGPPPLPPGMVGSITHCGNRAVALAAPADRADAVGVDLERGWLPAAATRHMCGAAERRWVAAAPDDTTAARRTTLLWSLKESAYKAWYSMTGEALRLPEFEIAVGADPAAASPGRTRETHIGITAPGASGGGDAAFTAVAVFERSAVLTAVAIHRNPH